MRRRRRPGATLLLLGFALAVVVALKGGPGAMLASLTTGDVASAEDDAGSRPATRPPPPGSEAAGPPADPDPTGPVDLRPDAREARDGSVATGTDQRGRRGVAVPLARVGDVELVAPVLDPVVTGFHEASTNVGIDMHPLGELVTNHNTTRFTPAAIGSDDAQPYLVLASRGRVAGPTSSVDVVARPDDAIIAPVTGRATDVRAYMLYGSYPDNRIEIQPASDPSLRVVMIHVSDVEVEVGDSIVSGSRVAAHATPFPFSSQIDRETEPDRFPHVHIEVQPFDAARPGDPPVEEDPPVEQDPPAAADAEPSG